LIENQNKLSKYRKKHESTKKMWMLAL
jgi:hypothetical protein